jgi:hypothetical protein
MVLNSNYLIMKHETILTVAAIVAAILALGFVQTRLRIGSNEDEADRGMTVPRSRLDNNNSIIGSFRY